MSNLSEKQSIRDSAKSLKKYGSTCNHVRNNETFVRHEIGKTDTLQGIALKYGCTTEQIRRINRLYASDSLFLRQYLMIPVEKNSPHYPEEDILKAITPISYMNSDLKQKNIPKGSQTSSELGLVHIEESKQCIDAFLDKIDIKIAESKKYIATSRNNITGFVVGQGTDNVYINSSSDVYSEHRIYPPCTPNITNQLPCNTHEMVADTSKQLSISHGKKVLTSLRKLEQQQDEFFELFVVGQGTDNVYINSSSDVYSEHRIYPPCTPNITNQLPCNTHEMVADTSKQLSISHGKKVLTSLRKLEQQQDEFFELFVVGQGTDNVYINSSSDVYSEHRIYPPCTPNITNQLPCNTHEMVADTSKQLSISHGKKVLTSLRKLEQQQDEFFEL